MEGFQLLQMLLREGWDELRAPLLDLLIGSPFAKSVELDKVQRWLRAHQQYLFRRDDLLDHYPDKSHGIVD